LSLVESCSSAGDVLDQDSRRSKRHRTLLAATLRGHGCAYSVRIRNISEGGALLEGSTLPACGAELILCKGELQAPVSVVWAQGDRCGVKFLCAVSVPRWLAPVPTVRQAGQQRLDEIQAAIRAGNCPTPTASTAVKLSPTALRERVAEELAFVQRLLQQMGEALVVDPMVMQRHATTLQQFDVASQIVGHLGRITAAADPVSEAEQVGMVSLRARLLRKSL
jgi:hypothetical protein